MYAFVHQMSGMRFTDQRFNRQITADYRKHGKDDQRQSLGPAGFMDFEVAMGVMFAEENNGAQPAHVKRGTENHDEGNNKKRFRSSGRGGKDFFFAEIAGERGNAHQGKSPDQKGQAGDWHGLEQTFFLPHF